MADPISTDALEQIFLKARTHEKWLDKPVDEALLRRLVEIMELGPTTSNSLPARIVFVRSAEAKRRLEPLLDKGNRAKTMQAPVTALIGYDLQFTQKLGKTYPHKPRAPEWYAGNEAATAFRNGSLQGAYFIIAARALGLDTGPMSGFDNDAVDREFFPGGQVKSNFICSLGYGDPTVLLPRWPRLDFDEVAKFV
ncbi:MULTISPECIES: malonic semialdehyde reductase [Rhodomicrobium]|uniref:malonic semialdehyde reductase n=1 Tax=Rhodomicrobium TaxID=1068 RepID=UPI000B4B9459|nr:MULTISPECIES: malonic semialdehyde reductase [Rhodomicrobium]